MLEVKIDVLDKIIVWLSATAPAFAAPPATGAQPQVVSPGPVKPPLPTETLMKLKDRVPCAVIEGRPAVNNDAARIRATAGTPAIQVNTGKGRHLDAQMIAPTPRRACRWMTMVFCLSKNAGKSLSRPASFNLGEKHKVAVLS